MYTKKLGAVTLLIQIIIFPNSYHEWPHRIGIQFLLCDLNHMIQIMARIKHCLNPNFYHFYPSHSLIWFNSLVWFWLKPICLFFTYFAPNLQDIYKLFFFISQEVTHCNSWVIVQFVTILEKQIVFFQSKRLLSQFKLEEKLLKSWFCEF